MFEVEKAKIKQMIGSKLYDLFKDTKYILATSIIILTGCSKNMPVDASVFDAANTGCEAYGATFQSLSGKLWFPTFKEEVVVVCSKPNTTEDLILSLSFKGKT